MSRPIGSQPLASNTTAAPPDPFPLPSSGILLLKDPLNTLLRM